ncbi:MAG: hypothetical protein QOF01_4301, partial [Thermomicrobiales bacterium]|nr:hypothetical protein [Thermomicrobiales bacterium]
MAVLAARRPTEQKRTRLSFAQRQALWGYLLVLP